LLARRPLSVRVRQLRGPKRSRECSFSGA
jgi:hypothetical protein